MSTYASVVSGKAHVLPSRFVNVIDLQQEDLENQNWNERYFQVLDSQDKQLQKYSKLNSIHRDFVSTAVFYARTIISELYLPDKEKSVLPLPESEQKGSGGLKFKMHGILFILASMPEPKSRKRFDFCTGFASKAMGHRMKGANCLFKFREVDLHVSLQILVDFKVTKPQFIYLLNLELLCCRLCTCCLLAFIRDSGCTVRRGMISVPIPWSWGRLTATSP